jgi:hypothetical protein
LNVVVLFVIPGDRRRRRRRAHQAVRPKSEVSGEKIQNTCKV